MSFSFRCFSRRFGTPLLAMTMVLFMTAYSASAFLTNNHNQQQLTAAATTTRIGKKQHNNDNEVVVLAKNSIRPLDGDRFNYLEPLKKFPSEKYKEKVAQKYEQQHPALLMPAKESVNNGVSEPSSPKNDSESSSSSVASTTTHFDSNRKGLGWYEYNNNNAAAAAAEKGGIGNNIDIGCIPDMYYADKSYFDFDKLTSKGPRKNSDIGEPEDFSRPLFKDGLPTSSENENESIRSGSWFCTKGGWPSKSQRATTEIFYVWKGFGCLTDIDGKRNYFSPGDTVILPKGWSGRWDIAEDVHKVWFVHDHENIEEDVASTIRVKIIHYNELVSSSLPPPFVTGTNLSSKSIFDVGPTRVSMALIQPSAAFLVKPRTKVDCFHVLEGSMILGTDATKEPTTVLAGDTVVLPIGWTGGCVIKDQPIKLLRVQA